MQEEAVWVTAIRAGSENAFTAVVERYQGRIARYLRRLVGDKAVAEDLTQETFLSAYTAIRKTDSPLALGPWLYKIATNHAYMHFRRQKLRRFLPFFDHPRHGSAPPAARRWPTLTLPGASWPRSAAPHGSRRCPAPSGCNRQARP